MSRSISFSYNQFYHCYCRGTDKRKIFLHQKDYERFIALLYVCNSKEKIHLSDFNNKKKHLDIFSIERDETLVDIGVYCLMPNHFHILIHEKEDNGISLFMQKLMTAYTMYFNKKYNRTGSLFESRFRAEYANQDRYLKYLFSYIHLNPIKLIDKNWKEDGIKNKKEALKFLESYQYSSYNDYMTLERSQKSILNVSAFPEYFADKKEFENEIFDWIEYVKVQP